MGRIVAVAYKPKKGSVEALQKLLEKHVQILREQGLASEREPIIMRSKDGIHIEVFEWKSADAIEKAHTNKVVQELWQEFAEVCDYVPLSSASEVANLFSEFESIN